MMTETIIEVWNIVSTGNWNSQQRGRIYSTMGCCPALNTCGGGQAWSIKDHAFTVPANPMSDRVQLVIEIYETEDNPDREILQDIRS